MLIKRTVVALTVTLSTSVAMAAKDLKRAEECEQQFLTAKQQGQTKAGFSDAQKADFEVLGQVAPHSFRKIPVSIALDILARTDSKGKIEGLSIAEASRLLADRGAEFGAFDLSDVEDLLDSADKEKVSAALRIYEKVVEVPFHAQVKVAALIGKKEFAGLAIDVFEKHRECAPQAFAAIAKLANENSLAGKEIWFTEDPERLLARLSPFGGDRSAALREAGIGEEEERNLAAHKVLRLPALSKMSLPELIKVFINLEPKQKYEDHDASKLADIIKLRVSEIGADLQAQLTEVLKSDDIDKARVTLRILEKTPSLSVATQIAAAELIANSKTASNAIDVLEEVREIDPQAFTIVARLALANARAGKDIWFTQDPERAMRRLKPIGTDREAIFKAEGYSAEEIGHFYLLGEIRPHAIKTMPIEEAVRTVMTLEPKTTFEGWDLFKLSQAVGERRAELTPQLQEWIETLLFEENLDLAKAGLRILEKVPTVSGRAQLQVAQLVSKSSLASDLLSNLKVVTPEAYQSVAEQARVQAETGSKPGSFTEDPERLLRRIQPAGGIVIGETVEQAAAAREQINQAQEDQKNLDQERRIEALLAKQRAENPQIRTGETDITEAQRRANLADLQSRASALLLGGSYLKPDYKTVRRYLTVVDNPTQKMNIATQMSYGEQVTHEGRSAVMTISVMEYDKDYHYKFNLPTMSHSYPTAYESGTSYMYYNAGDQSGWYPYLQEPVDGKTFEIKMPNVVNQGKWEYIGKFEAPNGVTYKKCFRMSVKDKDGKDLYYAIFAKGIGQVFMRSEQQLENGGKAISWSVLEGIASK